MRNKKRTLESYIRDARLLDPPVEGWHDADDPTPPGRWREDLMCAVLEVGANFTTGTVRIVLHPDHTPDANGAILLAMDLDPFVQRVELVGGQPSRGYVRGVASDPEAWVVGGAYWALAR
jgi:hypothetical protein